MHHHHHHHTHTHNTSTYTATTQSSPAHDEAYRRIFDCHTRTFDDIHEYSTTKSSPAHDEAYAQHPNPLTPHTPSLTSDRAPTLPFSAIAAIHVDSRAHGIYRRPRSYQRPRPTLPFSISRLTPQSASSPPSEVFVTRDHHASVHTCVV